MAKKKPAKKPTKKARTTARKPKPARARAKAPKSARRKPSARPVPRPPTRPAAPTPNPVRELAQRIVDLTLRQDDEGSFALYADNVESVEMGMPPAVGLDAIRQKFAMWRGMVSDSSWEARNVWVDGTTIIIEWIGRVTLAATGKRVDMKEVAIHEVEGGKIARERFYYDRTVLQP